MNTTKVKGRYRNYSYTIFFDGYSNGFYGKIAGDRIVFTDIFKTNEKAMSEVHRLLDRRHHYSSQKKC